MSRSLVATELTDVSLLRDLVFEHRTPLRNSTQAEGQTYQTDSVSSSSESSCFLYIVYIRWACCLPLDELSVFLIYCMITASFLARQFWLSKHSWCSDDVL